MSEQRFVDSRLLGTWKSDKIRTLEEWVHSSASPPDAQVRIANLLGKLVVRYTPARVFTEFEGNTTQCPYRVVATDSDSVAIVCRTESRDEIRHIHFVGEDLYWVHAGRNREFFARAGVSSACGRVQGHPTENEA